jgi:hypothetical protein
MLIAVLSDGSSYENGQNNDFYGVFDDPLLALYKMKSVAKFRGEALTAEEYNGWPSYHFEDDFTDWRIYFKIVEINELIDI